MGRLRVLTLLQTVADLWSRHGSHTPRCAAGFRAEPWIGRYIGCTCRHGEFRCCRVRAVRASVAVR